MALPMERARIALFALCIFFSILVFAFSVKLAPFYSDQAHGFGNVLDLIKQLPDLGPGSTTNITVSPGISPSRRAVELVARASVDPNAASATTKEDIEQFYSAAVGALAATIILAIGSAVGFLWSIAAITLIYRKTETWLGIRRAGSLSIVAWLFHLVGSALYSAKQSYESDCSAVSSAKEECRVHDALTVTMWLSFVLWTMLVGVLFAGRGIFASGSAAGRSRGTSAGSGKVRYPFDSTVDNVQTSSDMEMANQPKHATAIQREDPFAVPGSQQRELDVDPSPFADPKA